MRLIGLAGLAGFLLALCLAGSNNAAGAPPVATAQSFVGPRLASPPTQTRIDALEAHIHQAYVSNDFEGELKCWRELLALQEKGYGRSKQTQEQQVRVATLEWILRQPEAIREQVRSARECTLAYFATDRFDQQTIVQRCEEGVTRWGQVVGKADPYYCDALGLLANSYSATGQFEKAVLAKQDCIRCQRAVFGHDSYVVAITLLDLCTELQALNRPQEVIEAAREASKLIEQYVGHEDQRCATAYWLLAHAYNRLGKHDLAAVHARRAIVITYDQQSERPFAVLDSMLEYARAMAGQGEVMQAQAAFEFCLNFWRKNRRSISPVQPTAAPKFWIDEYVACLEKCGKPYSEDVSYVRARAEDAFIASPRNSELAAQDITRLDQQLLAIYQEGHFEQELSYYNQMLAIIADRYQGEHPSKAEIQCWVDCTRKILALDADGRSKIVKAKKEFLRGIDLHGSGKRDDALDVIASASNIVDKTLGSDNLFYIKLLTAIAQMQSIAGKHAESIATLQEAAQITAEVMGTENVMMVAHHRELARALLAQSQLEAAKPHLQQALKLQWKVHPSVSARHGEVLHLSAKLSLLEGNYQEAREAATLGIVTLLLVDDPAPQSTANCHMVIFQSYCREKRFADAIRSHQRLVKYARSLPPGRSVKPDPTLHAEYADAWRALGHNETAAAILAEAGYDSAPK